MSLALSALLVGSAALAQVRKCQVGGKSAFQESPCDGQVVAAKPADARASSGLPWVGVRPGMTAQEVRRAVPSLKLEATRPDYLMTSGVTIAGQFYGEAYFAFQSDRFRQFHASSGFGASGTGLANAQAKALFEKTVEDFRRQLSKEPVLKLKETPTMLSADAEWRLADARVLVSVSPITAQTSQLLINYIAAP